MHHSSSSGTVLRMRTALQSDFNLCMLRMLHRLRVCEPLLAMCVKMC
jgi:hypothetical protein